jgi:hypothetical protein
MVGKRQVMVGVAQASRQQTRSARTFENSLQDLEFSTRVSVFPHIDKMVKKRASKYDLSGQD